MITVEKNRYTYDDYAKLPEGTPYQLIEGELVMTPAPSPFHQIVQSNILLELGVWVKERNLGRVLTSPIDVYLSDTETYQPDIIFISTSHRNIIGEKRIEGAPDLVVEILSPTTGYYDLTHKKRVYAERGVKEYWVVDPVEKTFDVWENMAGDFRLISSARGEGTVRSSLLKGFEITLANVFEF